MALAKYQPIFTRARWILLTYHDSGDVDLLTEASLRLGPIIVWVQLRGRNAVAREFLQSSEGDRHGGEKLFFLLLGDRQSTWRRANHYVDLCCTKGVFAAPGWSSYRQKRTPRLEVDRSLGDERLVCHLDWKFTPLGFYRAIFCHKTLRRQRHWKSSASGRSEADDKTTKSDDSARKGAPLEKKKKKKKKNACTDWVTLWWCTFCPSAFRLVNFMINFFVVACPYQIKRNCLSSFWKKKKLVWFCEWAITFVLL